MNLWLSSLLWKVKVIAVFKVTNKLLELMFTFPTWERGSEEVGTVGIVGVAGTVGVVGVVGVV